MEKELLDLYSPSNLRNLTEAQVIQAQSFGLNELASLAKEYPNKGNQKPYIVLKDNSKPDNKQLHSLSTWANLHNLMKIGQKQYSVLSFKPLFDRKAAQRPRVASVQDLTSKQAQDLINAAKTQKGTPAATAKTVIPKADKQTAAAVAANEAKQLKEEGPKLSTLKLDELRDRYEADFGEEADPKLNKAQLIAAINAGPSK